MSDPKRKQRYASDEIVVEFDPNVCAHAAVCLRSLPAVFDVKRQRWIDAKAGSRDEIIAAIAKCPSGALSWSEPGGEAPTVEMGPDTEITVIPNGPLVVRPHPRARCRWQAAPFRREMLALPVWRLRKQALLRREAPCDWFCWVSLTPGFS